MLSCFSVCFCLPSSELYWWWLALLLFCAFLLTFFKFDLVRWTCTMWFLTFWGCFLRSYTRRCLDAPLVYRFWNLLLQYVVFQYVFWAFSWLCYGCALACVLSLFCLHAFPATPTNVSTTYRFPAAPTILLPTTILPSWVKLRHGLQYNTILRQYIIKNNK